MDRTDNQHALYNFESGRILAISKHATSINLLTEQSVNSRPWYFVNKTKSIINKDILILPDNFDNNSPWNYKLNSNLGIFQKDTSITPTEDIVLINLKSKLLDRLVLRITHLRRPFDSSFSLQDEIYAVKLQQAREFLLLEDKVNFNEDEFIFIKDFASLSNTDMNVASREIIAQANYRNKQLSFTETLRIKYVKAIVNSKSIIEINAVEKELRKDTRLIIKY
jgi:hypothetical protein